MSSTLLHLNALIAPCCLIEESVSPMDIKQLWLNVQDLWGALDEHPLLHASLGLLVLLVVFFQAEDGIRDMEG